MNKNFIHNTISLIGRSFAYNLKVIFANKFIYFFLASIGFFILVTIINLFSNSNIDTEEVYYFLIFPGLLLIFYPTTFCIQNDDDSRMLELIFGIPNYRYKVWLVRLIIMYIVVFVLITALAFLSSFAIIPVKEFDLAIQLMFPIFFLGNMAFMFSTLIKNGNGTAVVMVVLGVIIWILAEPLQETAYNVFLNPFDVPYDMNEIVWREKTITNRILLFALGLVFALMGLFNLQKRERYMK